MADQEDDFAPSNNTGYKVGEKKTLEELAKLDSQDESLRKWKESLGLKAGRAYCLQRKRIWWLDGTGKAKGKNVEILGMAMEVAGRSDVLLNLASPGTIFARSL